MNNYKLIKGIVKGQPIDQYGRRRVWIPSYSGSNGESRNIEEYPLAQVCGSELSSSLNDGDVVFISFEDGSGDFPVIMGKLGEGFGSVLNAVSGYAVGGKLSTVAAEIIINNLAIDLINNG